MLRLIRALLVAPALLALAGCCGNSTCKCNDRLANSLFVSVGRATGAGRNKFSDRELATVYLARYDASPNPVNSRALDSLPLPRATRRPTSYPVPLATRDTAGVVVISDNSPFSATTTNGNLSRYYYKLYVPRDSTPTEFFRARKDRYRLYVFQDIAIKGAFEADGCCTCYNNTTKRVRLSTGRATLADSTNTQVDLSNLTDVAGDTGQPTTTRTPVVIYLTK